MDLIQDCDLLLQTKRKILAHVTVCRGCCCGAVERGKAAVPVEWMKEEWKARGLKKRIQLTVSGCLGPCDISNVVSISSTEGTVWLGRLGRFSDYAALLEWSSSCNEAGQLLALPVQLSALRFNPFVTEGPDPLAEAARRSSWS